MIFYPNNEFISFISASRSKSNESSSTVFVLIDSAVDVVAAAAATNGSDVDVATGSDA